MKRGRLKKITAVVLSAILITGLAGCSRDGNLTISDEKTETVNLSLFTQTSLSGSNVGKYWSEVFSDKTGNAVNISYDSADYYEDESLSYRELLKKRFASSTADDLYFINAEDVIEFEKEGYWMDLSNLKCIANLSEEALQQSTYNDKVFSLPLGFTGFGFCWNVDMLKKYGLSTPDNLKEFMTVCETLKQNGITPYIGNKGFALTVPAMCVGFSDLYGQRDSKQLLENLSSGETPVSTYMSSGFNFIESLLKAGYLDGEQALNTIPRSKEESDAFREGRGAFLCVSYGDDVSDYPFETKVTALPVLESGKICVNAPNSRLAVNPESENLEMTIDFVEAIGTTENLNKSAEFSKELSCAKDAKNTAVPESEDLAKYILKSGQIPNQDFSLHFNTWENIRDLCRKICEGSSAEAVSAEYDAIQKKEISDYGH